MSWYYEHPSPTHRAKQQDMVKSNSISILLYTETDTQTELYKYLNAVQEYVQRITLTNVKLFSFLGFALMEAFNQEVLILNISKYRKKSMRSKILSSGTIYNRFIVTSLVMATTRLISH